MEEEKLRAELRIFKIKAIKEKIVLIAVLLLFFAELIFLASLLLKSKVLGNEKPKTPYIAVLNIDETITVAYANKIIAKLEGLKEKKEVKEFLFLLNTPGGSPSGADEINAYLKHLNKTKRVNLYVESMAASGGYYIASAIKPIVSNKNAVVGSIGVIMPHMVIKKLADKIGVESDNITVGKYKEPISMFEKASPEQKEYLHDNLLNPTYQNFLKVVAEDRNISIEKLKEYAEGKIFIASEVKGILVDKLSSLTLYKEEIKNRVAQENAILAKDIKYHSISLEEKQFPFLNVKIESDTLKSLGTTFLK